MEEYIFDQVADAELFPAPQGPGTHALVQSPFAFEDVADVELFPAPQGPGTHALVQSPFAWAE